jgi:hypothetical protein
MAGSESIASSLSLISAGPKFILGRPSWLLRREAKDRYENFFAHSVENANHGTLLLLLSCAIESDDSQK